MRTLILGLGNPILGDDGIGVRVAAAVHAALPPDAPVEVGEACVGGLGLMERLVGYDRVILVDAFCGGDAPPGTLRRLSLPELGTLSPTQHTASAHDTTLLTALAAGRQMGLSLPHSITIFAVEVRNVLDFDDELTPEVARALPGAVRAVLAELGCLAAMPRPGTTRRES